MGSKKSTFQGYVVRRKGSKLPVHLSDGVFCGIFTKRSAVDYHFDIWPNDDYKYGRELWRVTVEVDYSKRSPRAGEFKAYALHDSSSVRPYTDADGWVYGLGTQRATMERMSGDYLQTPVVSPVLVRIRYTKRLPSPDSSF